MKKLLLLSILLMVLNAQAQDVWTEYATAQPANSTGVRSISIVDENVTWLNMACGTINCTTIRRYAKTVNGGTQWTTGAIDLGPNAVNLQIANIHGVSADVAYASVCPTNPGGTLGGVWKTTDGGSTWTRQASAAFSDPASFTKLVYFWNANEGIAAGDPVNGYFEIYRTTDGGSNWTRIASTPALVPVASQEYTLTNQFTVSGNSIWIETTSGRLLHSADKGATWSAYQTPIIDFGGGINGSDTGDVAFSDANNGLLLANFYELYRTQDAGATWAPVRVAPDTAMKSKSISAVPGHPHMYVTVGEDLLLSPQLGSAYTLDGGRTWIPILDLNYVGGSEVAMYNENVGFASGFSTSPTEGGVFKWNGMASLPVQNYTTILFNAFIDTNNNGVQDADEDYYLGGTYSYQVNAEAPHYLNSNSEYYLPNINPLDTYNLGFSLPFIVNNCGTYLLPVTQYNNVSLPANSGTVVYNFPLVPTDVNCNDLSIELFPRRCPRPSFNYLNTLIYKNNGNQIITSGTITFVKDPNVTISYFWPTDCVITPTGFTFNFNNLRRNQHKLIEVSIMVPAIPTVSIDQLLTSTATITPTDLFPENNTISLQQAIVASYDPNDITEHHGGKILHSSFTGNDELTYTIRFENTGTADALNINVVDELDAQLDETSVRMIDASHPYVLDRVGAHLAWNFADINLPPSVADTTTGKGYIVFAVKPKPGYAVGDIIPNTASIYFDTNPAIVTNTFNTEFVANLSVNQFSDSDFAVYPNPTNSLVNISAQKTGSIIESISLTDVLGKVILSQNLNQPNTVMDISQLSGGFYLLQIKSNGAEKTIKIIKD